MDLLWLDCEENQLTSLDVSKNKALEILSCHNNQLTSLDVNNNTALKSLWCDNNQLTSLDVSNNTALYTLYCDNNQLTSLDVNNNRALNDLYCFKNQLTSLDVSNNKSLEWLWCFSNQLTSLDVSNNTDLYDLRCYNNQLTSFDVSNNRNLVWLWCSENQLTSLDISNGNNSNLEGLNFKDNPDLSCVTVDNQTQSGAWRKQYEVWYRDYYKFDWDDNVVFSEDCSALSNQDINNTTFEVYPNPANNFITIDSNLNGNYNLVSILGKTVGKGTLRQGDNTIDLSNFNKVLFKYTLKQQL